MFGKQGPVKLFVSGNHDRDGAKLMVELSRAKTRTGKTLTIAARPLFSLGTSGKAIATEFKV